MITSFLRTLRSSAARLSRAGCDPVQVNGGVAVSSLRGAVKGQRFASMTRGSPCRDRGGSFADRDQSGSRNREGWTLVKRKSNRARPGSSERGDLPSGPTGPSGGPMGVTKPLAPIAKSSRQQAVQAKRQLRQTTVENVLQWCLTRGSVTKCEVEFMTTHSYAEALRRAGENDHNRKRSLKTLLRRVTVGLAKSGIIPEEPSEDAQLGSWNESSSQMHLNSDLMEARKILIWRVPESMKIDVLKSVVGAWIDLRDVLKIRRTGVGSARRIELFLSSKAKRSSVLDTLKQQCHLRGWRAVAGRARIQRIYDRRDRSQSSPVTEPEGNMYSRLLIDPVLPTRRNHSTDERATRLRIGTLNLEGACGKDAELVDLLKQEKLHALAVTETWFLGGSERPRVPGYYFLGKAAEKVNARGRPSGGVGFLVADHVNAVAREDLSPAGLLWIQLRTNGRDVYMAAVYAPQAKARKQVREDFFVELQRSVAKYARKGLVVLLGDFNARVGRASKPDDHFGMFGEDGCNANCRLVRDLVKRQDLYSLNGRKPDSGVYTRIRGGVKTALDYVIVDNSLFSSDSHARVLEDYDCGSDHRPVVSSVCLPRGSSLRPRKRRSQKSIRAWKLHDPQVAARYQAVLEPRLSAWSEHTRADVVTHDDVEGLWDSWRTIVLESAREVLGESRPTRFLKPWWNDDIKTAMKHRRALYRQVKDRPATEWKPYYEAAAEVKRLVREAKQTSWDSYISAIERSRGTDARKFFALTRRMDGGKKSTPCTPLELDETAEHFASLGTAVDSSGPVSEEKCGSSPAPSFEEIVTALASIPARKAVSDEFSALFLQYGGTAMTQSLEDLFKVLWTTSTVPGDFTTGVVVPIHKKGSKTDPSNYRGITLMNVVCKLYSKVILNRLAPLVEAKVCDEQGGFRSGRACEDQVFAIWETLHHARLSGSPVYLAFIDFQKAFDSVDRARLWAKLRDLGVDGNLMAAIRSLYEGHSARVRIGGALSMVFRILKGVKQGCGMSPDLFKVFVNDLASRLRGADAVDMTCLQLSFLMFADDLVLMSSTEDGLQRQLDTLSEWCQENSILMHPQKTKIMAVNSSFKGPIVLDGKPVECVTEYRYLGMTIRSDLSWASVFADMRSKILSRVAQLHFLFTRKDLSIATRLSLYKSLVLPLFVYGAGVWWLTASQLQQLERIQLRVLKTILGTPRSTTTVAVLAETGVSRLRDVLDVRKLQFAGKLELMCQDRLVGKLYRLAWADHDRRNHPWCRAVSRAISRFDVEEEFTALRDGHSSLSEWKRLVASAAAELHSTWCRDNLQQAVKCSHLAEISELGLKPEAYFSLPSKLGSFYFKLRAGSLALEVEEGRFHNLPRHDRMCRLCDTEVEDVKHFCLRCPALALERKSLFLALSRDQPDDERVLRLLGKPMRGAGDQETLETLVLELFSMWKRRCVLRHTGLAPTPSGTPERPTTTSLGGVHAQPCVRPFVS